MINFDYYYYVVYEFELGGGLGQCNCEYKTANKITHFSDIEEMQNQIQKLHNCIKPPKITFYSLLRREKRII